MNILFGVFVFLLGLVFGSFYSCISYRIPNKISTIKPGSFCPKCKKTLKWYMNIPLFSYIFLKGKCAYCKNKISIIYPLTEFLTALIFLFSFIYYGISYNFLIAVILSSILIIVTITDLKYYYISDRVIIIGVILILLLNYLLGGYGVLLYKIVSALADFSLMYLVKIIGDKAFKKESLGGGDIKLMAFVGAAVGFIPSLIVLFIASILGLIFSYMLDKKKEEIIPFGPFLLISTVVIWFLNIDYIDIFSILL